LFCEPDGLPDDWERVLHLPTVQMIANGVDARPCPEAVALGTSDVDDMLALVGRAQPGPFERRTVELGDYLGIRDDDGALIAMAGMRMHAPGYVEISAVCTDDHARGRGFASSLVCDLVGRIRDRGETPILHVLETNVTAIRLYELLGFEPRTRTEIIGVRAPQ
jgi:ribosomal protein S18 acetylase RimI-like enzyme